MTDPIPLHPDKMPEPPRRRIGFLKLSGLMLFLAILAYVLIDNMQVVGSNPILDALYLALTFVMLISVVAALFFVYCYRSIRFGEKVYARAQYVRDAWGTPMRFLSLGAFSTEAAHDEKELSSRRKRHRALRRQLAKNTPGQPRRDGKGRKA